ncbi:MAG: PocR ligand-binding domain-containing protein, partial [Clostridia bacterium]|nr:PocR ligand-binding domain-containing protein [Clostridia bacterium]
MLEQVNALYGEMKDFSVSTGISSKIFNADGTELLSCGKCIECEICRLAGGSSVECSKTHAKAGKDTLRFGGKYIYLCPMGFVHASSPVLMEDSDIVTAVAGPILIIDRSD